MENQMNVRNLQGTEDFELPEKVTGDCFVDKHSLFRGAICCWWRRTHESSSSWNWES